MDDDWACPVVKSPAASLPSSSSKEVPPKTAKAKKPTQNFPKAKKTTQNFPKQNSEDWDCPVLAKEEKELTGRKSKKLRNFIRKTEKVPKVDAAAVKAEIDEKSGKVYLDLFGGCGRVGECMSSSEGIPGVNLELNLGYDLTCPRVIDVVKDAITCGKVAAFFCGPPCSTFSRSRRGKRKAGSSKGWPRALRSKDHPAGLPVSQITFTDKETWHILAPFAEDLYQFFVFCFVCSRYCWYSIQDSSRRACFHTVMGDGGWPTVNVICHDTHDAKVRKDMEGQLVS